MSRRKVAQFSETFTIKDSAKTAAKTRERVSNMIQDSAKSNSKVSLLSEIAVTHAGIVNGNLGYYKPKEMRDSAMTWIKPFEKPLLFGHQHDGEPLGRVKGSIYKTITPMMDGLRDASGFEISHDLANAGSKAVGFLQNLVSTTDPDAVAKVMDERYLTVSVHGSTSKMECSICGTDWLKDGMCEHRFGQDYELEDSDEKKLAFWIAGEFIWDELSYVNMPADPIAIVVTKEVDSGNIEQIHKIYNYQDVTTLKAPIVDSATRLMRHFVVNDSLSQGVILDQNTTIQQLDKIYGHRIFNVPSQINDKGKTMDKPTQTPAPETPAVETPAAPAAPETPVAPEQKPETPAETPAAPAPTEKPAETPAPAEKPAEVPAPAEKSAETPAKTPAETPAPEGPEDMAKTIETLRAQVATMEKEKQALIQDQVEAQTKVRTEKINEILDLKSKLGIGVKDEEKATASEALQKFPVEALDSQIQDLKSLIGKGNHRTISPKDVIVKGETTDSEPMSIEDRVDKLLAKMSPEEIIVGLLKGTLSLPVTE